MKFSFNNTKISSIECLVPRSISRFEDEIEDYPQSEASSRKLMKAMGYKEHRIFKNPVSFSSVAHRLLEKNDALLEDVDALVVVTQTPDRLIPSTSSILHGILGLPTSVFCLDINDGCAGYIKGVVTSASLLESGMVEKVLLVCGDVLSQFVSKQDRNSYPLIGDAVSATILERSSDARISGIRGELFVDGRNAFAITIPVGGSEKRSSTETLRAKLADDGNIRSENHLVMNGRDVFAFTQSTVAEFLTRFLQDFDCVDADRFYFHQANKFILDKLRVKLGIEDPYRLPTRVIESYGNSSSATIPLAVCLDQLEGKQKKANQKAVFAGFGVGLSFGAFVTKTGSIRNTAFYQEDI